MTQCRKVVSDKELAAPLNFIERIIIEDLSPGGRCEGRKIISRFPPEPNGYLHLGHAKSICLNFGLAKKFDGHCNLRFDDTNPVTEKQEYIDAIKEDVTWLGYSWGENVYFASDYFDRLYGWAVDLIKKGKAYVDHQTPELISLHRGNASNPPIDSPYRDRTTSENLHIFQKMKDGKIAANTCVLRAKIDMNHPNMNMRDPILYRIMHENHPRTGNAWCIYPLYDFAHGLEDWIENVTHSICTLEFENHRELYDWFIDHIFNDISCVDNVRPRQHEFSRLNLTGSIMSKRHILQLVNTGIVSGWDDPRLSTLRGVRRRGVPPSVVRKFCSQLGVTQRNASTDQSLLDDLLWTEFETWPVDSLEPGVTCPRRLCVVDPIRVCIDTIEQGTLILLEVGVGNLIKSSIIENYSPSSDSERNPTTGNRFIYLSRMIVIEKGDFVLDSPGEQYKRLAIGKTVKLRHGVEVTATRYDDPTNTIHCTHDPESLTRGPGKNVCGVIHWALADGNSVHIDSLVKRVIVHWYSSLLKSRSSPPSGDVPLLAKALDVVEESDIDIISDINPDSIVLYNAFCETVLDPALVNPGQHFQFERLGVFVLDQDSTRDELRFNLTVKMKENSYRCAESDKHRSRKESQRIAAMIKEERKGLKPKDMFRVDPQYSLFDVNGIPTHYADGTPLTKSAFKKLLKESEKQLRLFNQYNDKPEFE